MIVVIDDGFVEFRAIREQQFRVADAEQSFGWAVMFVQWCNESLKVLFSIRPEVHEADRTSASLQEDLLEHEDGKVQHDANSKLSEQRKSFEYEEICVWSADVAQEAHDDIFLVDVIHRNSSEVLHVD